MQIWTKEEGNSTWKRQCGAVRALDQFSEHPALSLVFYVDKPDLDTPQLGAAIRVAFQVGFRLEQLIIATTHPSLSWLEPLRSIGINDVVLCAEFDSSAPNKGSAISLAALSEKLCPHLHARTSGKTTLSVCGAGNDRIVLARRHIRDWCLRHAEGCPHIGRVLREGSNEQ